MGLLDIALNKVMDKATSAVVQKTGAQNQATSEAPLAANSLYMKQKFTFLNDTYSLFNADQTPMYNVKGNITGLEFNVTDAATNAPVITLKKKLIAIMPEYSIEKNGQKLGTIKKKMKLTKVSFEGSFNNMPLQIDGNFIGYDFTVSLGGTQLCIIKKELLSWADCYAIHYDDATKIDAILGIVLAIDNALHNTND